MVVSMTKKVESENPQDWILDSVAFYGRSFNEYTQMFNFTADEWKGKRILDCNSGPASFTAEAASLGIDATACDPMYATEAEELVNKARHDIVHCLQKNAAQRELFDESTCSQSTEYASEKFKALDAFADDFARGKAIGRYVAGQFPHLPFIDGNFSVVLSAHLLFVYASKDEGGMLDDDTFSLEFHLQAIREMIRLAAEEVRIYPLRGPNKPDNPMFDKVMNVLALESMQVELVKVDYKDIVGADTMLRIRKG